LEICDVPYRSPHRRNVSSSSIDGLKLLIRFLFAAILSWAAIYAFVLRLLGFKSDKCGLLNY